jgi:NADH:ubiquinone oxidoreductase subunit 5 (subunit L)/multisubunit Na+/H+ antiporter MnhA subunit
MLLILLGVHIIFFAIGYLSADTAFTRNYYYSLDSDLGILYFVSVLVGILILIGWLVFYSRNNGFKTFYPRKASQLYAEWLIILAITAGLSFIPFTLSQGHIFKWKSAASLEEVKEALKTLDMANGLIANDTDYFKYESEYDNPIPIPDNMKLDP